MRQHEHVVTLTAAAELLVVLLAGMVAAML